MPIELRPHNIETYEKMKDKFKESKKVAVIQPPGTGKSYLALKLLEENKGKKAIYLAPSKSILHNIKRNIFESGMNIRSFSGLKIMTYAKLMHMSDTQIAKLDADLIILDEFHHCGAPEWGKGVSRLLKQNLEAYVLGLSATPIRYLDNGRDMAEELFEGNVASEMNLEQAINRGILPKATYVSALYSYIDQLNQMQQNINKNPDSTKRNEAQKLFDKLKGKLDEKTKHLPELLAQYMTNKNGKYIVFCKDIKDMKQKMKGAQEMFGNVNSNITLYAVSSKERANEKTLSAFEQADDNTLKLMFAVDMLNEGYHIKELDGVIMMRPTFSPIVFEQQLGRALSVKSDNGNPPVILDLVDNFDSCKIIEDFCERMKQYDKGDGTQGNSAQKRGLAIFDQTKEFREIARKIAELCKKTPTISEKTPEVQELSRKYRIRERKMAYILNKYKTMEQFIKMFRKGALDKEDKKMLQENLNMCIDIHTGINEGYSRLLKEIMPNQAKKELLIYDSDWMTFLVEKLDSTAADVIKMAFGNYKNGNYTYSQIGARFGISAEEAHRTKESGVKKLMSRSSVIQDDVIIHNAIPTATAIKKNKTYTDEEKSRIAQIYDEIFNSNLIFLPDKEFELEPNSLTTTQVEKLALELNWIKERASLRERYQEQGKKSIEDEAFIKIEELDVEFETYYRLKKTGIINIYQLRKITREDLMLIANMKTEIVEEIELALNKVEMLPEEIEEKKEEVQESSKTDLEKVKASKEWLERDVARLKADLQDAEELLEIYTALLNGDAPNNGKEPNWEGE